MSTPNTFAGNLAQFGINGVNYDGNKGWSVRDSGEEKRTDNTADNGFSNREVVMRDCEATIEGDWNAGQNLLDDPPNLKTGVVLTNVKLYLNGTSSPFWILPIAVVTGVEQNNMAGDVCNYRFTIKNKGTFTRPTGTFTPVTPGT